VAGPSLKELDAELGGKTPPELAGLTAEELVQLTKMLRDAKRTQKQHIKRAFDSALSHVPFLLRGPLKKMLGA
jgi:hypothetical protein